MLVFPFPKLQYHSFIFPILESVNNATSFGQKTLALLNAAFNNVSRIVTVRDLNALQPNLSVACTWYFVVVNGVATGFAIIVLLSPVAGVHV